MHNCIYRLWTSIVSTLLGYIASPSLVNKKTFYRYNQHFNHMQGCVTVTMTAKKTYQIQLTFEKRGSFCDYR